MSAVALSYGESLPDQVDRVALVADAQYEVIGDVRDLYRDIAVLEREYATKMQSLAQKAVEKKNRKMANAVVGDDPTKAWNEQTLTESTLENAYSKIIGSMVNSAQEHVNLSDALNNQVVGVLAAIGRRNEGHRKKQAQFYQKLLTDRDRLYGDRVKSKQKYDEECDEVETYRQKQERAQDDKHAERAAKQYQQQQSDMLNAKNVYIIATTVANRVKERFYADDLPDLENQYQKLQTHLVTSFVSVLHHAQALQLTHHDALKTQVSAVDSILDEVDSTKDQELFIEHNVRPFRAPSDWAFEPCAMHYDTGDVSVEDAPKVYLQNKLSRSRAKMADLLPLLETKRKEADQVMKVVTAYTAQPSLGDVDEVIDNFLDAHHQATFYETSNTILGAEITTLEGALRGDEGSQSPHSFKSASFTIPTECAYCGTSIWGLSKQGKTCKSCGISVHSKCELKIAADCTGVRGSRHKPTGSVSRTSSVLSRSTSRASSITAISPAASAVPTASSFAQPELHSHAEELPTARMVFDFSPTSPFELAVQEGALVHVMEDDDGSGWVKVADERGGKGLVPASYIETVDSGVARVPQAPSQASPGHQQGSGKFVRALFDYQPQGSDELDVRDGVTIELTGGASGGQNYAEGWWEGIDSSGKKGIFPSNYVELV